MSATDGVMPGGLSAAYLVRPGSVVVPPELTEFAWLELKRAADRRRANGARLRPEEAALVESFRQAAGLANGHRGHVSRPGADMAPSSELTTKQAAQELRVTPRHYRRLAKAAGIQPSQRNSWLREDHVAIATHWKAHR